LLREIEANKVDVIVVYKIDRLSRSLLDFTKLIEIFDRHKVTFVSVTQSFNTTTSMGRLTLNVLLSFAQFEREVTGERIRDKFAASKKKGMWMGGCPPLGYDITERKLVVNSAEAKSVNVIFRRYLDFGCVRLLRDDLKSRGVMPKSWTSVSGRQHGGKPFDRGALYCLLKNRVYLGETIHKGAVYQGEHEAIIERELFDAVQARLAQSRNRQPGTANIPQQTLLQGLIFDDLGNRMTPTYGRKADGRRYRYYVSRSQLSTDAPRPSIARVPAAPIEHETIAILRRIRLIPAANAAGEDVPRDTLRQLLSRVELRAESTVLSLNATAAITAWRAHADDIQEVNEECLVARAHKHVQTGEKLDRRGEEFLLSLPRASRFRGGRMGVYATDGDRLTPSGKPDPSLIKALVRAHAWMQRLIAGTVSSIDALAVEVKQERRHVSRILRLASLSPSITSAMLEGRQPAGLRLSALLDWDIPLSWDEQQHAMQCLVERPLAASIAMDDSRAR
jgi:hypothetical protein